MTRHEMNTIVKVTIPMFMPMVVELINFARLAARLPKNLHPRPTA